MRIGLISGEYPPMQGGVADFTRELGRAFVAQQHRIFVLTSRRGIGLDDPYVTVSPIVQNWNAASLRTVRRWIREKRLDVVNLQYQTAAYNMAGLIHLIPRLVCSVPVVTTFHDLRVPYLFPKAGRLREWVVRTLARDSDAVIVTNAQDEQRLAREGIARVHRIPIGSNIESSLPSDFDRSAWRVRFGVEPEEILVGYFGFVNHSKGVDTLLEALAQVRADGMPLKLLMIGGRTGDSDPTNAAYARRIDDLIASLGLEKYVLRTGYVTPGEVSASFAACDLCALPYRDGVSFRRGSFMAALAHGCPIITTSPAVPMPELANKENVYLVAPGSVSGLAAALQILAEGLALRLRLAEGARALAEYFTWDRIAQQTAALFAGLVK